MARVRKEVRIQAAPDEVWKLVSHYEGWSEWMPGIERVEVDGDKRLIHLEQGGSLVERETEVGPQDRRFRYVIEEAPFPLEMYDALVTVDADGDAAVLVWDVTVEPEPTAEAVDPLIAGMVEAARAHLEE